MLRRTRPLICAHLLITSLGTAAACSDSQVTAPPDNSASITTYTGVQWNERAIALVVARQPTTNGQAAVSRILTYLSVAQFRAVAAALDSSRTPTPPSLTAAIGGASAAVLNAFFPLDVTATEAQLKADLATPPAADRTTDDVAGGEALGRSIAAAVLAKAATDNYLVVAPGVVPTGPDKWVSSSAAVVRSLSGTRPFFLTSPSQLRPAAPPAVGSAPFITALTEVRQIADTRTAAQIAIAQKWNSSSGPFTAGVLNLFADSVIRANRVNDAVAARILAFTNAAAFDAQIACWDAKFAYWYPRPTQADAKITMAIALPNHPSYPSGHSCMTGAFMTVLGDAFSTERSKFDAMIDEAGMSRVYGGIHFRFDIDAGRDIGRKAAALTLTGSLQ